MKKRFFTFLFTVAILLAAVNVFGQGTAELTGKVVSGDEALIGANVVAVHTGSGQQTGTITDVEGKFKIANLQAGAYKVTISFIGYTSITKEITLNEGSNSMENIELQSSDIGIAEVSVLASVAVDRKTPVAISTIKPTQIEEKLGTQEYPEILKSTPGVYATKQGGAFGDSRINIRGFDQRNTATMINGVPVNDMENGWVYWSNWAGLSDVTRSMQVQRGLGASKVAVPSLGGTVNILTKTTDAEKGGNAFTTVGSDGYSKYGFTLSTGLSENNWAFTVSLAKSKGDGYVDGTQFESYSYFANISKRINTKHSLAFSIFGAPQWHGQRSSDMSIETFKEKGIRYNMDWGYKNGQVTYVRKNYYHKPQAILNHFWTIDNNTSVMTAVYASIGTGGGTGSYGNTSKFYTYMKDDQVDFDRIVAENEAVGSTLGSESILRSSVNNHNWYGVLSTFNKKIGNIDIVAGIDGRYYKGEHYRIVTDLLGGDFFVDEGVDANNYMNIAKVDDKIDYYNDGLVRWLGLFGQAEYTLDKLSAFVALSASTKAYKRVDYFNYFSDDNIAEINSNAAYRAEMVNLFGQDFFDEAMKGQETDWASYFGYMVKGGANYNLTDNHNVFVNGGYFERQPDFDAVYLNYVNLLNEDAVNEKVISFELGYGYRSSVLSANLNAYYTQWKDKTFTRSFFQGEDIYLANILGVDALHMGVEFDFIARPTSKIELTGFVSVGDWKWMNNIENVQVLDESQNPVGTVNLFVKDLPIGDAAQLTAALGANFELIKGLKVGFDYNYYDRVYAEFNVLSRGSRNDDGSITDSWQMPAYGLIDANLRYNFKVSGLNASMYFNVNNLLDTEYISDAYDGGSHTSDAAEVYYGWGRSWSVGLKLRF